MSKVKNLEKVIVRKLKKMNKNGQALVEFVIILPIIMMIIFVIIDFSNPALLSDMLDFAKVNKTAVVLATTGLSDEQINEVEEDTYTYTLTWE